MDQKPLKPLSALSARPARGSTPRRQPDDIRTDDAYLRAEWLAVREPVDSATKCRQRALLEFATAHCAWVIKPYGGTFEPADLTNAIWDIWRTSAFLKAESPWGYTNGTLKLKFSTRAKRDRDRTGDLETKRKYKPGSIQFKDFGSEAIELDELRVSAENDRQRYGASQTPYRNNAILHAVALLCHIGLTDDQADALVEFILERASRAKNSFYDAVSRETQIAQMLDISLNIVKNTNSLLMGNSAGDLGTIAAHRLGIPSATVKNIVNSTRNLLREAPPSDWRDRELAQADRHTPAAARLRAEQKSRAAGEAL